VSSEGAKPKPTLAVSVGDPGGIGPEVVVRALADRSVRDSARWRVLGVGSAMHEAAQEAGVEPFWWRVGADSDLVETTLAHDVTLVDYESPDSPVRWPKSPSRQGGELSFRFVEDAIAAARRSAGDPLRVDGIVTGPISKEAWALAGRGKYPGHTELLATRFGAKRHAMMFVSDQLRVILATAHVPLMDIRNALTIGRVFDAIDLGHEACQRLGISKPRIAVCGLNPHAGEGGLLGDEEERIISPAIRIAQQHGVDARGPFPGDTIFRDAIPRPGSTGRAAKYDLVVAMYHDQGLIPIKLLFRDEAVNVTVGLPTVRTSPDHGTAFDIAGRGLADAGSTRAAMLLAARMARSSAVGGVAAPRG
jgi:4-hydroxythreonine-4-phosphate dehydrogenase